MSEQRFNLGIIGLNRRTVSIALLLKAYTQRGDTKIGFSITGQDGDKDHVAAAKALNALDEVEPNTRKIAETMDIILLDLPPSLHAEVLAHFAPYLKAGAVVLDLSTDKMQVLQLVDQYFPKNSEGKLSAYLVGVQPLVAQNAIYDANTGPEHARVDLFENCEMIIAPDARCPEEAVKLASDFASIIGLKPRFLMPDEYDALANYTEHLPQLLSFALFASLRDAEGQGDLLRAINPAMGVMLSHLRDKKPADIVAPWVADGQITQRRIDDLIRSLYDLRDLFEQDDESLIRDHIASVLEAFSEWDTRRRIGKWKEDDDVAPPSAPTSAGLGGMFGFGGQGRNRQDER